MPRAVAKPTIEPRRYRRRDGTVTEGWSVRWRDDEGRRRRKTFVAFEEADLFRAQLALNGEARDGATDDRMLLAAFWPVWLADARSRLAAHTLHDYESRWKRLVAPSFGASPMGDIRPRQLSQWKTQLLADGVGPEAVRKSMVLLQAMFTLAVEWGEVDENPVRLVRKPRQGRRRAVQITPPAVVERLRRHFLERDDLLSATILVVLAYAGLRPGELLALELRHVRDETLLIEQSVAEGRVKVQKTGRAYRTVDLLAALRDDLEAWIAAQRLTAPRTRLFGDQGWWTNEMWNNWRNRRFYPALATTGTERTVPYGLRHSFASLLIRDGRYTIVEIAEQMGHAPTETLKTYAHVIAEYRRQRAVPADHLIARSRADASGPSMNMPTGPDSDPRWPEGRSEP
jgi:integrase